MQTGLDDGFLCNDLSPRLHCLLAASEVRQGRTQLLFHPSIHPLSNVYPMQSWSVKRDMTMTLGGAYPRISGQRRDPP